MEAHPLLLPAQLPATRGYPRPPAQARVACCGMLGGKRAECSSSAAATVGGAGTSGLGRRSGGTRRSLSERRKPPEAPPVTSALLGAVRFLEAQQKGRRLNTASTAISSAATTAVGPTTMRRRDGDRSVALGMAVTMATAIDIAQTPSEALRKPHRKQRHDSLRERDLTCTGERKKAYRTPHARNPHDRAELWLVEAHRSRRAAQPSTCQRVEIKPVSAAAAAGAAADAAGAAVDAADVADAAGAGPCLPPPPELRWWQGGWLRHGRRSQVLAPARRPVRVAYALMSAVGLLEPGRRKASRDAYLFWQHSQAELKQGQGRHQRRRQ
eukprot:scaffold55543_cov66-Phaeocystis_antarctica.AAC.2